MEVKGRLDVYSTDVYTAELFNLNTHLRITQVKAVFFGFVLWFLSDFLCLVSYPAEDGRKG